MLRQWGDTCVEALEAMIKDIREGKIYDGTMRRDFAFLAHLIGRHDVLTNELRANVGPHRGPDTPNYHELS